MEDTGPGAGRVAVEDFDAVSALVLDTWLAGVDLDWSSPAGTLEWSCLFTADHVIDCVFSYALFFASRKLETYPRFGELHALPGASSTDMIDGLRAVTTMLSAVVAHAPPDAAAVLFNGAQFAPGRREDFAARGSLELILHAEDIATGLGQVLDPPRDICRRLYDHTDAWPGNRAMSPTGDPWADLLVRSGRPRPAGG